MQCKYLKTLLGYHLRLCRRISNPYAPAFYYKKMKIIILFGPPGAGKGTQSELLAKNLEFKHLSTGALLREEMAKKTELGRIAESIIASGRLVSDDVIIGIVKNFLESHKQQKGVILDGFPRTLPQAQSLSQTLKDLNVSDVSVINLNADENELTKRLLKRAAIESRPDDTEQVIRKRLEVYNKETYPLINYYSSLNVLKNVQGMGPVDKVQESIVKALNEF